MQIHIKTCLLQAQDKGRRLAKELKEIAAELDKVRFKANVSKVAGSSAAIAGTVVSVVGGILSFFTFGAALPLVIAGVSVAATGGLTATGAFVADKVISKKKLRQVQKLYEEYLNDPCVADLLSNEGSTQSAAEDAAGICLDAAAKTGAGILLAAVRIGRAADLMADTTSPAVSVVRVATTAGRAFIITGLVFDAIFLPVTIYDLVTSSLELHRKKGHPGGEGIRKCIEVINTIDLAIADCINDLIEPGDQENVELNEALEI